MKIKKFLSIALMFLVTTPSFATLQTVTRDYSVNGYLRSERTGNAVDGYQQSFYDSLQRFDHSLNKDGKVSQRVLYGPNGQVISLVPKNGSDNIETEYVAVYTVDGGKLQVGVAQTGSAANVVIGGLSVTADQIQAAYDAFKAQYSATPPPTIHNQATFAQFLAIATGQYTTNADGTRTLKTGFVEGVSIKALQASELAAMSQEELIRFLGFRSGGGAGSVGGVQYTNLGSGGGGAGSGEAASFISEVKAFVAACLAQGAGSTVISFSGDAHGAVTQADASPSKNITVGDKTYNMKDAFRSNCKNVTGVYDPLVSGQVTAVVVIDGKSYVVVKASTVDMFDGKGAQAADGEEIYVAVSDEDAAAIKAQMANGNASICIAGNVTTSVDGHKTMIMNEGGYETAGTVAQADSAWKSKNQTFYNTMLATMAPVWAVANATGQNNSWSSGWNFLEKSGAKIIETAAARIGGLLNNGSK